MLCCFASMVFILEMVQIELILLLYSKMEDMDLTSTKEVNKNNIHLQSYLLNWTLARKYVNKIL